MSTATTSTTKEGNVIRSNVQDKTTMGPEVVEIVDSTDITTVYDFVEGRAVRGDVEKTEGQHAHSFSARTIGHLVSSAAAAFIGAKEVRRIQETSILVKRLSNWRVRQRQLVTILV